MEETAPIITVCVPVYNAANYALRCIHSLFNQTISDKVEFIFVDDASHDKSVEIIEAEIRKHADKRCTLLRHDKNRGQTAARLTAYTAAVGTYIAFIDSDDYLDPRYLEVLLEKAQNCKADIVFSGMVHEYNNKSATQNVRIQRINRKDKGIAAMLSLDVNLATKLIKSELISNHLDVFNRTNITYGEDMFVVSRLCHYAEKVAIAEECLYHYVHTNVGQVTSKKRDSDRLWSDMKKCMNEATSFFAKAYPDDRYKADLEYISIERKYTLCLFHSDMADIRRHADWLREVEMRHISKFAPHKAALIIAVHFRIWPCANIIMRIIRFVNALRQ